MKVRDAYESVDARHKAGHRAKTAAADQ